MCWSVQRRAQIPAFSTGGKELGPVELESKRRLASVWIRVERVIGEARNRYIHTSKYNMNSDV